MTRVAIIGSEGTVGRALTPRLSEEHDVIGIDLPDIDILNNPDKFKRAIKGADTVIHLAGVFGLAKEGRENWRSPHRDPKNRALFNAALRETADVNAGFIHASSIHVEDTMGYSKTESGLLVAQPRKFTTDVASGYGKGKREQEAAVESASPYLSNGGVSIRLGAVTPDGQPMQQHSNPDILSHEQKVWVDHDELADLVGKIIEHQTPRMYDVVYAVSNNDGRFHDTTNQYGWVPQANSAQISN